MGGEEAITLYSPTQTPVFDFVSKSPDVLTLAPIHIDGHSAVANFHSLLRTCYGALNHAHQASGADKDFAFSFTSPEELPALHPEDG